MTDWNKGQLILLAGACIAVFGSVYILGVRGPMPDAAVSQTLAETPHPTSVLPTPAASVPVAHAEPNAAVAEPVPEKIPEPPPIDAGLRQMAENPSAADVPYLGDLAQRDGDPRLRVLAIEGLQRAAIAGGDDGASSRALRRIAASRDPQISHAARRAISQVSQQNAAE